MIERYRDLFDVWLHAHREQARQRAQRDARVRIPAGGPDRAADCAEVGMQQAAMEFVGMLAEENAEQTLNDFFRPRPEIDLIAHAKRVQARAVVTIDDLRELTAELLRLGFSIGPDALDLGAAGDSAGRDGTIERVFDSIESSSRIFTTGLLPDRYLKLAYAAKEQAARDDAPVSQSAFNDRMAFTVIDRAIEAARDVPEIGPGDDDDAGRVGTRPRGSDPSDSTAGTAIGIADGGDPVALIERQIATIGARSRLRGRQGQPLSEPHGWAKLLVAAGFGHTEIAEAINTVLARRGPRAEVSSFQVLCAIAHMGDATLDDLRYVYQELLDDRAPFGKTISLAAAVALAESKVDVARERAIALMQRRLMERTAAWAEMLEPGRRSDVETAFITGIESVYERWLIAGTLAGAALWPAHVEALRHGPTPGRAEPNKNNVNSRLHYAFTEKYPWLRKIVVRPGAWIPDGMTLAESDAEGLTQFPPAPMDPATLAHGTRLLELLPLAVRNRNRILGDIGLDPDDARIAIRALASEGTIVRSVQPLGFWKRRGEGIVVDEYPNLATAARVSIWQPEASAESDDTRASALAAAAFHLAQMEETVALHEDRKKYVNGKPLLRIHDVALIFRLEVEPPA